MTWRGRPRTRSGVHHPPTYTSTGPSRRVCVGEAPASGLPGGHTLKQIPVHVLPPPQQPKAPAQPLRPPPPAWKMCLGSGLVVTVVQGGGRGLGVVAPRLENNGKKAAPSTSAPSRDDARRSTHTHPPNLSLLTPYPIPCPTE